MINNNPTRCSDCIHNLTCFIKTRVISSVQEFKLIAMDTTEAKNTGCSASADDLIKTLGNACTAWQAASTKEQAK